jgi:mono/diheme cytochrome c family protein
MKMKNVLVFLMGSCFLFSVSFAQQKKGAEWPTPDKYKSMKNQTKADEQTLADGKALWNKYCKSCHGAKGLGDGPKGAGLKTFPGDFSAKAFQGLSDGAMYYRAIIGRGEMPNYEKSIPKEEDRWKLVTYMRTMGKK